MRSATDHGPCAVCGKTAPGLYWTNRLIVLDFGVDGMPPIEPDTTQPVRCDDCEIKASDNAVVDFFAALANREKPNV